MELEILTFTDCTVKPLSFFDGGAVMKLLEVENTLRDLEQLLQRQFRGTLLKKWAEKIPQSTALIGVHGMITIADIGPGSVPTNRASKMNPKISPTVLLSRTPVRLEVDTCKPHA